MPLFCTQEESRTDACTIKHLDFLKKNSTLILVCRIALFYNILSGLLSSTVTVTLRYGYGCTVTVLYSSHRAIRNDRKINVASV